MRPPTFSELVSHPKLLGPHFAGSSWDRWKACGKALFNEAMTAEEVALFRAVSDRDPPSGPITEMLALVGRGGGKSAVASAIAVKLAVGDYRKRLRPGERAMVMVCAVTKEQGRICADYIRAAFEQCPALAQMVVGAGEDFVELNNGVIVQVFASNFRLTRGRTLIAVIVDEVCFLRDENSASPDVELIASVRPGLARMGRDAKLILVSTVHRRSGVAYQRFRDYFAKDGDVLVIKGTTTEFNPGFDASVIAADIARDPALYSAEYNSAWRDDLHSFISRELIEAAVDDGVVVRPPLKGVRHVAGCDAGGGTGEDSFTACFSHLENRGTGFMVVQDLIYERKPPFDPALVVDEICALMDEYDIAEIVGDRFAAGFTIGAFERRGKRYVQSERDRSEVYIDALPLFSAGRLRLLDSKRQAAQFAALERRTFPTGKDRVNHPSGHGHHDDIANSAALSLTLAAEKRSGGLFPQHLIDQIFENDIERYVFPAA